MGVADECRRRTALQPGVCLLQPLASPQRPPKVHLGADRHQQPLVVPRLLDVVAGAATHRLDGAADAAPGGDDQHGQGGIQGTDPFHQVQAFLAGRGVAGVVEIEDREVELRAFEPFQGFPWRARGRDLVALVGQEHSQCVQDVDLVVGGEDPDRCGLSH